MSAQEALKPYTVKLFWSEEDEAFVAHTEEFGPAVSALDEEPDRAVAELAIALSGVIETYRDSGWDLPEPRVSNAAHETSKAPRQVRDVDPS